MGEFWMSIGIGCLNAVQIQIFNFLYTLMAGKLNDWENQRLPLQFENSMIVKKMVFLVVNSFISLFFLAFLNPVINSQAFTHPDGKKMTQREINKNVMSDLQLQLASLFVTLIIIQNFLELYYDRIFKFFVKMVCGDSKKHAEDRKFH